MNLKSEVVRLQQKRYLEEQAQRQEEEDRRARIQAKIESVGRQVEQLFAEAQEILWVDDDWEVTLRRGWENQLHTSYVWRMTAERKEKKGLFIHRVAKVDIEELTIYFAPEARRYPFSSPRLSYFTQEGLREEVARQVLDLLEQRQKHKEVSDHF
ncbi:MAG TPA: hypothetical protein VF177_17465 [Anaerolineae bacterium]